MAPRTRNHILEEESRWNFRKALPPAWVCRDKNDDYGIDCEVELFTDEGNATGLVFWVQLKATDSTDESTTKKLYFEREKIRQFISYDIPVLIVRYTSYNQSFYTRWAKGLQDHSTKGKSVSVIFTESCRWAEQSAGDVTCYLRAQNWVKQGKLSLPIPTFIERSTDAESSTIPYNNLVLVKTCLQNFSQHVAIRQERRDAVLFTRVSEKGIFMSLADIHCAEMKVDFEKVTSDNLASLRKHILVLFCSLMYDLGRKEIANDLVFEEDLFPVIFKSRKYLISILPDLLQGRRIAEVLQALGSYNRCDPSAGIDVQLTLRVILIEKGKYLDKEKNAAIRKFLEDDLLFNTSRNDAMSIAHAHYNLAQHCKSENETETAIKHYFQARKHGEFYKRAFYYYSDLAGLLFSIGKYRFASAFYAKAIKLGAKEPITVALYADALMYSGYYEQARDKFDEHLLSNAEEPNNEEWQLKYSMLATHLMPEHPPIQRRNPKAAEDLAAQGHYDAAIAIDFLCGSAWYGLGIESVKARNYLKAFSELTFSALLYHDDAYIWALSLLTGLDAKVDHNILIYLVRVAHEYTDQGFSLEVQRIFSKTNPESVDSMLELIDLTITDELRKPVKVRVFTEGGDFEEMRL